MNGFSNTAEVVRTVEMHTAGEPLRLVVSGMPPIVGDTLLEKRRYCRAKLDSYRRWLMAEPRGHADMFGAYLVSPDNPQADMGAIYLHNEGYSTMCGHATIAIVRYLVDSGVVKRAAEGDTEVKVQAPCGLLRTWLTPQNVTRFHSVPSFVLHSDLRLPLPDGGECRMDLSYGGAFYVFVRREDIGFSDKNTAEDYLRMFNYVRKHLVDANIAITHPESADLGFLHGVIFTDFAPLHDTAAAPDDAFSHITVFADGQIDRSPCGSGTTACCALLYAAGRLPVGRFFTTRSIIGSEFRARVHQETECHGIPSVVVEVEGRAFYTGRSEFTQEPDDPQAGGFLIN